MGKLISKRLITESDMHDYDLVKESGNDGSTILKLTGPFAVCETLNNNNRMYHLDEMVEECRKFQEVINNHRDGGGVQEVPGGHKQPQSIV